MQDEVNEKIVSLCITGGKISARILKAAIKKALEVMDQEARRLEQRAAEKRQEKGKTVYHGKQSMEKLMKQNCQLSNIEVTDGNIKSFDKYARKYSIDYSLKKDTSVSPPRYFVFFKARDVDVLTAAFKEYTGVQLQKSKKPSILMRLALAKERAAKHREREKTKQKDRGQEH